MVSIETELREEFDRVDPIAMPPGTIDRVLRTAGRQRRRRRLGTTLGAVACAAAVTVPVATLRHSGQQAASAPRRSLVVGAYEVFSGHTSLTDRVLDPATGKYVPAPMVDGTRAQDISFSPDGRNVMFRPST
jgi:hypothetical protein